MRKKMCKILLPTLLCLAPLTASAQSFRVQCPTSTITHPVALHDNNSEPVYTGPTTQTAGANGYLVPSANVNGAIKCQQISGGDGYSAMGDGTQTYMFSFGPLSGLVDIANGLPGTEFPSVFNTPYLGSPLQPGDPATTGGTFTYNGAVGLTYDLDAGPTVIDGHVDARQMMDIGVMNGNIPAPLMAIDEDDEFFLTLSNVGMIMRPDLFEQHTVHFHGYPNASSFYDGVPDASVAINIGASFTYYYLAPDAGTYFWHCHITPPEHLQMGMVGQLYVRPRQDRVAAGSSLYTALSNQQADLRTACSSLTDILCSNPLPAGGAAVNTATGAATVLHGGTSGYAYNDGDGTTYYDVEYPIQIHGFDPNFHFVGMTFNPEGFADMKDKYFLLNGRSYPDTVTTGPLQTQSADGVNHFSQPLPAIINIPAGKKALLRISDLDVSEYQTLASLGIPMKVIGYNAKLLRDQAGNNMYYNTNSITLGGGESLDVILDATGYTAGSVFYLYTPNLDHLSNDAENFGGLMTEVHVN
jgi:FtsP/CotA-like multicopper oxidase with cupredoxin domain